MERVRLLKGCAGQSAVEAALWLPFIALMALGGVRLLQTIVTHQRAVARERIDVQRVIASWETQGVPVIERPCLENFFSVEEGYVVAFPICNH